jgi:hypothetical protein
MLERCKKRDGGNIVNMAQQMLELLGEKEYTHFEEICEKFAAYEIEDIAVTLRGLESQGYAQEVVFEGYTYFQRTLKGHSHITGQKPYSDDTDIPF